MVPISTSRHAPEIVGWLDGIVILQHNLHDKQTLVRSSSLQKRKNANLMETRRENKVVSSWTVTETKAEFRLKAKSVEISEKLHRLS